MNILLQKPILITGVILPFSINKLFQIDCRCQQLLLRKYFQCLITCFENWSIIKGYAKVEIFYIDSQFDFPIVHKVTNHTSQSN